MAKNCNTRVNDDGYTVIEFSGTLKSYNVYGTLMNAINKYMIEDLHNVKSGVANKVKAPIISLEHVTWMDSSTLPLLLSCCQLLSKYYGKPITFIHPKSNRVRGYLFWSRFNSLALGERRDGIKTNPILNFDQFEAASFLDCAEMNKQNIVEAFQAEIGFYKKNRYEQFRTKLATTHKVEWIVNEGVIGQCLHKNFGESKEYDDCAKTIIELISNAVLYSETDPFVCVQMKSKKEYYFSICDNGIGFSESIKRKNKNLLDDEIIDPFDSKKYLDYTIGNTDLLSEFFAFFTALEKVSDPSRDNLRKLIRLVTRNGGTIKIHTDRVLIVFKKNDRFYATHDEPYKWMNHIIENSSSDYRKSPLCIYRSRLRGVHIEVEFVEEEA